MDKEKKKEQEQEFLENQGQEEELEAQNQEKTDQINPDSFAEDSPAEESGPDTKESDFSSELKKAIEKEMRSAAKRKLLNTIAAFTANRVPAEKRDEYKKTYVDMVEAIHDELGYDELIGIGDLRNLPPWLRIAIGTAAMVGGPLLIPKLMDKLEKFNIGKVA